MGADTLECSGVVQQDRADGRRVIDFRARHCPGCNGRCGVRFRAPPVAIPEALDLPPGADIVVTASARGLRRGAFWVFGPPLVAVAGSTALAHFGAWNDWTLAAVAGLAIAMTPALARWKYAA
ncbi:MAG: SoxR reducing system RseC family protein [Gammaproteobacteria bacterium]|nr:SoxR reducing system RseC family protein [Gammaproteobacteria bacterium]